MAMTNWRSLEATIIDTLRREGHTIALHDDHYVMLETFRAEDGRYTPIPRLAPTINLTALAKALAE
jgi:hypothetical protein